MQSFLGNFYRHLAIFTGHIAAYFTKIICHQELSKLAQSGHTASVRKKLSKGKKTFLCLSLHRLLLFNFSKRPICLLYLPRKQTLKMIKAGPFDSPHFSSLSTSESGWPDVGIKIADFFQKLPKSSNTTVLTNNVMCVIIAQDVSKYLGYFWNDISHLDLTKIAQSGHTGFSDTFCLFLSCSYRY